MEWINRKMNLFNRNRKSKDAVIILSLQLLQRVPQQNSKWLQCQSHGVFTHCQLHQHTLSHITHCHITVISHNKQQMAASIFMYLVTVAQCTTFLLQNWKTKTSYAGQMQTNGKTERLNISYLNSFGVEYFFTFVQVLNILHVLRQKSTTALSLSSQPLLTSAPKELMICIKWPLLYVIVMEIITERVTSRLASAITICRWVDLDARERSLQQKTVQ